MSKSDGMQEQIVELESAIAHLQHDYDQLNEMVVRQQAEIGELKRSIGRLEGELEQLAERPEKRDLLAERPPHY
jgi:SlyX protein